MFIRDKEYVRVQLDKNYGGQEQSGIVVPTTGPYIFLFSGEGGEHTLQVLETVWTLRP